MSIRLQMALLLIALSTVFLGTTWMMHAMVMAPAFTKLEQDAAHTDAERCVEAIRNDIENLSNLANDWGAWDDTRICARSESFICRHQPDGRNLHEYRDGVSMYSQPQHERGLGRLLRSSEVCASRHNRIAGDCEVS